MERKAQASTEYLVILAVVIVVAVVVAGLLGNFLSFGGGVSDSTSKTYWKTADIALEDWLMSSTSNDQLVVKNNQMYDIEIKNITVGTSTQSVNLSLATGEKKTVSKEWEQCDSGASYSYSVSFIYDNTEDNLTGKVFTGAQKIVGTCK